MKSLDHYLGRPVVAMDEQGITLVGGARILSEGHELPPDLEGWHFATLILSATKAQMVLHRTVPKIGGGSERQEWRILLPHGYRIMDTAVSPNPFQPGQLPVSYPVPPERGIWESENTPEESGEHAGEEIHEEE